MDTKDLRIGNFVFGNYIIDDIKESCVCMVDILDAVGHTGYSIWASSIEEKGKLIEGWESFSPIPLSEQWLLKFGFGYWDDVDEWYSPDEQCILRIEHFTNGEKIGFFEQDYGVEIKYLHQLQNLFFALTGEELTLKP